MDGVVFSDHTPTPGLIEYKKAIEPVQVLGGSSTEVEIINRYDFVTLDHLQCSWSVSGEQGNISGSTVEIPKGIQPGETAKIQIPSLNEDDVQKLGAAYLKLTFVLKEPTLWAKAGHEIAWGQIQLQKPASITTLLKTSVSDTPQMTQTSPTTLSISNKDSTWTFDLVLGTISSWKKASNELIHTSPDLGFYRALTDNDMPSDGWQWQDKRLHQVITSIRSVTWKSTADAVSVVVTSRIAPPVLEWSIDTTTTYTFRASALHIAVSGKPQGINLPPTLARIGLTLALPKEFDEVSWFGRGSGESYSDKKESQAFGKWSANANDGELFTDYEFPQESGNRTDVSWVSFAQGGKGSLPGLRASFGDRTGCSFSALHYTTKDLDAAKHPYELKKNRKEELIVRLDWKHHGLGTGSCGPKTMEQYALKCENFEFDILLE